MPRRYACNEIRRHFGVPLVRWDSGSSVGNKLTGTTFCARVADASQETSANQWRPTPLSRPGPRTPRAVVLPGALRTGAKEAG